MNAIWNIMACIRHSHIQTSNSGEIFSDFATLACLEVRVWQVEPSRGAPSRGLAPPAPGLQCPSQPRAHLHRCSQFSRTRALPVHVMSCFRYMSPRGNAARLRCPAGQGDTVKVRGRPYTDPRAVTGLTFLIPADHKYIILYRWRHFIIPAGVRFGATFIWVRFVILRGWLSQCYSQLWYRDIVSASCHNYFRLCA